VAESEDQSQPRGNLWLVVLAGAAIGYGCLVRLDSVVFLPALALLVAWGDFARSPEVAHLFCAARPRKRLLLLLNHLFQRPVLRRLILFAIPVALAGGIILGLNTLHFGAPFASAYSDQPEGITFSTPILAGLYGFLMSVGKGVFFFSPALVLCLFGIAPMLRRAPVFGAAILALFLSFLLFQSAWRNWAGGWCWGPRHIVQAHALLALPIAFWIAERWSSPRRVLLTSVLAIGALVQIYGCSQNFIEFYRVYYQDPAPPNATPLYDLQSSPELAYRYAIFLRGQDGQPEREIALTDLVAPINDSIYIVQNSPWPRYAEMARTLGLHDFFWLHLATPR
jgi:hypothetical protein